MSILATHPVQYTIVDVLRDLGFKVHFNGRGILARYEFENVGASIKMTGTDYRIIIYHNGFYYRETHGRDGVGRPVLEYIDCYGVALNEDFRFSKDLDEVDWKSVIY